MRSSRPRAGSLRRPVALRRGARRKATSREVKVSVMPATDMRARRPGSLVLARALMPLATNTLFSPTRGATSAMVPSATRPTALTRNSLNSGAHLFLAGKGLRDRPGELEGDPYAGEVAEGVAGAGLFGVDDGDGLGERAFGLVVVGYDEVDAEFAGEPGLFVCADAAVGGDDEVDALLFERAEAVGVEAVPFFDAAREEIRDAGGQHGEEVVQQRGRSHAVDVVVAVDHYALAAGDGLGDALDGDVDAVEGLGIVEVVKDGPHEGAGGRDVGVAAVDEQLGDDGGHGEVGGEGCGGGGVRWGHFPPHGKNALGQGLLRFCGKCERGTAIEDTEKGGRMQRLVRGLEGTAAGGSRRVGTKQAGLGLEGSD